MYLARRRGEEAMLALHHMAYIAQTHTQRPHTQESADPQHVGVCFCLSSVSKSPSGVTACSASVMALPKARLQHDSIVGHAVPSVFTSVHNRCQDLHTQGCLATCQPVTACNLVGAADCFAICSQHALCKQKASKCNSTNSNLGNSRSSMQLQTKTNFLQTCSHKHNRRGSQSAIWILVVVI